LVGVLAAASIGSGACSTPAAGFAERGDAASLSAALAARQRAGDLSNDEAASIARSVIEQGLRSAPASDAAERIRNVRACARAIDSSLAARMDAHDEGGAEAALARLDAGSIDPSDVRRFAADADPRWRAVGVRSLVRDEDRATRLAALVDASPLVRREAARACRAAADAGDVAALAEAVRVDPEPIVRTEAVRALAALPAPAASSVVATLRDAWPAADAGLREDIAIAWASPAVWASGGRDALRLTLASEQGAGVIDGAAAALRSAQTAGGDAEMDGLAAGVLARAIDGGARRARLQALAQVPLDPRHRAVLLPPVQRAASDGDLEVRVSALSRLAEIAGPEAVGAVSQLEALAQPESPVAARARFALAAAGDRRVQQWLEEDLAAQAADSKLFAANALATLGVAARAAPLLADSSVSVRMRAACTIVDGARFRR
jgi:hypothetical protein